MVYYINIFICVDWEGDFVKFWSLLVREFEWRFVVNMDILFMILGDSLKTGVGVEGGVVFGAGGFWLEMLFVTIVGCVFGINVFKLLNKFFFFVRFFIVWLFCCVILFVINGTNWMLDFVGILDIIGRDDTSCILEFKFVLFGILLIIGIWTLELIRILDTVGNCEITGVFDINCIVDIIGRLEIGYSVDIIVGVLEFIDI